MVTRQPGKWMAKGWGFSCEITWPFWPFSLAAIPNSQETPAYNSVKTSKGMEKERVEKKQAGGIFFHGRPLSARSASGG